MVATTSVPSSSSVRTSRGAPTSSVSDRCHLHTGTRVILLVADLHIRVIDTHTGELLRELTLDPTRDHQPRGVKPGPAKRPPTRDDVARQM